MEVEGVGGGVGRECGGWGGGGGGARARNQEAAAATVSVSARVGTAITAVYKPDDTHPYLPPLKEKDRKGDGNSCTVLRVNLGVKFRGYRCTHLFP